MEVRTGPELGLSKPAVYEMPEAKRAENPANLPGTITTDQQTTKVDAETTAIRASQAQDTFQVLGNTVDIST